MSTRYLAGLTVANGPQCTGPARPAGYCSAARRAFRAGQAEPKGPEGLLFDYRDTAKYVTFSAIPGLMKGSGQG